MEWDGPHDRPGIRRPVRFQHSNGMLVWGENFLVAVPILGDHQQHAEQREEDCVEKVFEEV